MSKSSYNTPALAAFIASKDEIDTILQRFVILSAAHFNRAPDAVTWGDVGILTSYLERLRDVSDAGFHEGGHAV